MKKTRNVIIVMILAAISAGMQTTEARADSRIHVGVDLGGIVAAFDHGPRYVYTPPVVYERRHSWRPPPPPPPRFYPPPRWHHHPPPSRWHHQPPPPPRYDRHSHRHHQPQPHHGDRDRYRR